mgnify:CR=1 FL=1
MNHKKYLFFLFLSLLITSCNNSAGPDPIRNSYYPIASNLEWEYNTKNEIEYYDTLGNIKNSEVLTVGNTIVQIEALNDTLKNFNDLIRFVSFEVGQNNNKAITWYENKDDGLYGIAYKNAGASQPVIPKIINGRKYLKMDDLKQIGLFLNFNLGLTKTADDSLRYWSPARKVLAYPIKVGNTWNELKNPFYRNRVVKAEETINVNGTNYNVYKIGTIWTKFNIVFNDYISTKYGLVLRELLADSVAITNVGSPDGIGFAKIKTHSKLVRRNF